MRKWNWWLELYFMEVDDGGVEREMGLKLFVELATLGFLLCLGLFFRTFSK